MLFRTLICIVSTLPFFAITYLWLTPESVRWLLTKEKYDEAKRVLRKAAEVNGKKVSEDTLDKLTIREEKVKPPSIFTLFSSKILLFRFINCSFCWITCALLFYGMTLNSVALAGNTYLDFTLTSLVEIPAYFSAYILVNRYGRRKVQSGSFLITTIACVGFVFVSHGKY